MQLVQYYKFMYMISSRCDKKDPYNTRVELKCATIFNLKNSATDAFITYSHSEATSTLN